MCLRLRVVTAIVAAAAVTLVISLTAVLQAAQPPARPAPPSSPAQAVPAGPKASEKFQNLKLLGDLPASQMHEAMVYMSAAVGFNCESCHVRKPDGEFAWEKDDKDNKVTARKMIELTRTLNKQFFDGNQEVTCATCHQGRRSPMNLPPTLTAFTPDQLATQKEMAALPPGTRPPAPKETPEQVIAKYYDAIGGEAAAAKVTSAVLRGTATNRAGVVTPGTITEKAPGLVKVVVDGKPPVNRAFDGAKAWTLFGDKKYDIEGVELLALAADASPWLGARLKTSSFTRLQGGRYERIDGREVITISGAVSPDVMESVSFDRASGLLVRRIARLRTVMGRLQVQIDYADYRAVNGVKVPFEVRVSDWEALTTWKFTDVKLNAAVDDASFAK
jgi:photosynthetic reaction center cytochrome c subunit